ncbi:MAG: hypothetical protein ACOYH4_04265 [Saccharofermentanales bacterium]|jgi:predicted N-formylglutamate amidohydrolase
MKINLGKNDLTLLSDVQIRLVTDPNEEIDLDSALDLLQEIYRVEAMYANSDREMEQKLAEDYAHLADKIYKQIS